MTEFCNQTLGALKTLIASLDSCLGMKIEAADGFQPVGEVQACDCGVVDKEWVDQHGPGLGGDEFYGTVTWKLGDHYVVARYAS